MEQHNSESPLQQPQVPPQNDFANQTLPTNKFPKPFLLIVVLVPILLLSGIGIFVYTKLESSKPQIVDASVDKTDSSEVNGVTIKYLDVKGALLKVSQGHYLSGKNLHSKNPILYYDGNEITKDMVFRDDEYLVDQSLSDNGLHYSIVTAYYPHYPIMPLSNTHNLYIDGKKIRSERFSLSAKVSNDGKEIVGSPKALDGYVVLSPDGTHRAEVKNGNLFVDGKVRVPNLLYGIEGSVFKKLLGQLQVTNSGHYLLISQFRSGHDATSYSLKYSMFIDDKEYALQNTATSSAISFGYINDDASHYLVYDSDKWILDGKPIQFQVQSFPSVFIDLGYNPEGYVEMIGNTIYVYKNDKTYVADKIPSMPANISTGLEDNFSVVLDKVEGIGNKNTEIRFKGRMMNNSDWKEIYLTGAGGSTSSQELTMNNSPFFALPSSIGPGQTVNGELFSVVVSAVALPGSYDATLSIQGGTNQHADDVMSTSDVTIRVNP